MKKLLPLTLSLALTFPFIQAEENGAESKTPMERKGSRKHGGPSPHGKGGMDLTTKFMRNLNLDESQKSIADQLREANESLREEYRTQMESLTEEMKSLHQSEDFNELRMIEIGGELGELRVKQGLLMKKFIEGLKPHLNEEQLGKLTMMKDFMKKMHDRHRGGQGPKGKPGFGDRMKKREE